MSAFDRSPGFDLAFVATGAATALASRDIAGRVVLQPMGDGGGRAVFVVIEIVEVAIFALSGRHRLGGIGGATNQLRITQEVVAVGAGGCFPGRNCTVDLASCGKWRAGGVVAALAVRGGVGWVLGGQDSCCVAVLMARETGVQTVTALTVTGADGGDVPFTVGIGYQGGVDLDVDVAIATGILMDIYRAVRRVAGANAFWRIEDLAGPCGAVVAAVNLVAFS